jgi:predicted CoA-binding protein
VAADTTGMAEDMTDAEIRSLLEHAETIAVARAAVAAGAGALWLQLGISSDEAREIATGAGLTYVEDRCLGATAREMDIRRRQRT